MQRATLVPERTVDKCLFSGSDKLIPHAPHKGDICPFEKGRIRRCEENTRRISSTWHFFDNRRSARDVNSERGLR